MEPTTDERSQYSLQDRGSSMLRRPIRTEQLRKRRVRLGDVIENVLGQVELDHGGRRCKGSHQADRSPSGSRTSNSPCGWRTNDSSDMAPNVAAKYPSGQLVALVLDALMTTSTRSPILKGRWSRCSIPPNSIVASARYASTTTLYDTVGADSRRSKCVLERTVGNRVTDLADNTDPARGA